MSKYYAIVRSNNELAHYGVQGMKWGVRKAIERGNSSKLSRLYRKAEKKLNKLNDRADIKTQERNRDYHREKATAHGVVGGLSAIAAGVYGAINRGKGSYLLPIGAAIGLPQAAYHGIRASRANKRTTSYGHRKAVSERDAWKQEMNEAFKGTEYAKKSGENKSSGNAKNENHSPRYYNDLSTKERKDVDKAMKNWVDAFEKHYQTGLSRGMTHEQAERYSNDYVAKHGFAPVNSSKKRRSRNG